MRDLFIFILAVCLYTVGFDARGEESFDLAVTVDWKPYLYINQQGEPDGEDLRLLRRTLQRLGYELNAQRLPEQRMALELKQGEVDVILGAAYTKTREAQNFYSIPYRKETIVFGFRFSRNPYFRDVNVSSLLQQNFLVSVNKSGWFGEEFQRNALDDHDRNLIHAEGTMRRMQLLKMGRVDAVVGDRKVLEAAAQQLGLDDFMVSKQVIHETRVHFLFSRNRVDKAFMQRFNQALIAELTRQTF
ncbi:MAG: hypothetical protein CBB67_019170 [Alteromonadaceae bacterium TMED7]|nr:hypothetical protein [Alteromonadaceae bacterium]MCP4864104.1 transporter substrate-binding domain-containing protein [Alteromonas sp.]RPH14683.1 MAG: hypothetical protein CBB67_019170 [Alteromonadaceae bacterium TMED7]